MRQAIFFNYSIPSTNRMSGIIDNKNVNKLAYLLSVPTEDAFVDKARFTLSPHGDYNLPVQTDVNSNTP